MGLFSKKWRCMKCDTKHRKNPEECQNCGHTVLQQVSTDTTEGGTADTVNRTATGTSGSATSKKWVCNHCKQEHDEEPTRCKVCGTEEFTLVGDGESESGTQTEEEDDVPTFSNIEEVREYEKQNSATETESVNYRWLAVKFVTFWVAVAVVLYFL